MEKTLINLIQNSIIAHPSSAAIKEGDNTITYFDLYTRIKELGTGLMAIGVKPGTHVALISEKSAKNIVTEFAIAGCGAIVIPISPETGDNELLHILTDSNPEVVIIDTESTMNRVASIKTKASKKELYIRKYIVLDSDYKADTNILNIFKIPVYAWDELVERGRKKIERGERQFDLRAAGVTPMDIQSINYTAGTTSIPKGVLLSHENIISTVLALNETLGASINENWSSYLPGRTIFERIIDYLSLLNGNTIIIGKPDIEASLFSKNESNFIVCNSHQLTELYKILHSETAFLTKTIIKLNLLWYTLLQRLTGNFQYYKKGERIFNLFLGLILLPLYSPIKFLINPFVSKMKKTKVGPNLKGIISVGNYLPKESDRFFNGLGINVIEGYGLTEASGYVSIRERKRKSVNDMGNILRGLEISIRDISGRELPIGQKGIIYIRGPQVMQGYYNLPELTKQIISPDGWLNTGDIGAVSMNGKLSVTGKEDFRIPLNESQYIEPEPIEETITQSDYIDNAILVNTNEKDNRNSRSEAKNIKLVIVPKIERLKQIANKWRIAFSSEEELVTNRSIVKLIKREIKKNIHDLPTKETTNQFIVVPATFKIGKELTINYTKKRREIEKEFI